MHQLLLKDAKEYYKQFGICQKIWAYYSISIMVYGTQKATMSIVAFVLLATGFISHRPLPRGLYFNIFSA